MAERDKLPDREKVGAQDDDRVKKAFAKLKAGRERDKVANDGPLDTNRGARIAASPSSPLYPSMNLYGEAAAAQSDMKKGSRAKFLVTAGSDGLIDDGKGNKSLNLNVRDMKRLRTLSEYNEGKKGG
jgi:hypothetical protein